MTPPAGQPPNPSRSVLTGDPLPPGDVVEAARRRNAARASTERRRLLLDTLTVGDVAAKLGVSKESVLELVRDRRLVVIDGDDEGMPRVPAWQLVENDGIVGVVAGVQATLEALPAGLSGMSSVRWFEVPKDHLAGETPIAWLRRGDDLQPLLEAAQARGAS